jgi:hypothetical protein
VLLVQYCFISDFILLFYVKLMLSSMFKEPFSQALRSHTLIFFIDDDTSYQKFFSAASQVIKSKEWDSQDFA